VVEVGVVLEIAVLLSLMLHFHIEEFLLVEMVQTEVVMVVVAELVVVGF
jgi:hypothetical protein